MTLGPMFNQIRKRFHPLWRLRQWAWYRKLQALVDPDVAIRMNGFQVYLKLLRDLSLILPHNGKESATKQAFSSLLGGALLLYSSMWGPRLAPIPGWQKGIRSLTFSCSNQIAPMAAC